jgi:hypothetical protein
MSRARPSSLALTAVGLVFAAILGVQLGQSAISEINPIHFQGPLERPQAITPPPEPAPYDPYGQPYVWSMTPPASLVDCIEPDCGAARTREAVRLTLAEAAGRDPALPYWRDATPATELRPWAPGTLPDRSLAVERYMHYPVNREQAAAPAPELKPAPQPETTAATMTAEVLRPPPVVSAPSVAPEPAVGE